MNKNSIFKSLVMIVAVVFSSYFSFAGTGASGSPYLVCGTVGFKLTSNVAIPTSGSIQWFDGAGGAISGATSLTQSFPALNSDSTNNTLDTIFKVVVYSQYGCPSDSGWVYVTILPPPTVHASIDNSMVCTQQAPTVLNLGASTNGTPTLPSGVSYTYSWTGGSGTGTITTTTTQNPTTTPPATAGAYTYAVAVNYSGLDINGTGPSASTGSACSMSAGTGVTISTTPTKPVPTISGL